MPSELKGLQDYYKPLSAGDALSYTLGQQHLALQQQQLDQQGKNLDIDNTRQALSLALKENPIGAPALYNQLMQKTGGAPLQDPTSLMVNPDLVDQLTKATPGSPEYLALSNELNNKGATARALSIGESSRRASLAGIREITQSMGQGTR